MAHDYEKTKKIALVTILGLGAITVIEVFVALLGKGYIVEGMHWPVWLMGILMIVLSLTKAYFIVLEFMHMKYEVPSLMRSVLLPMVLLVWGIIAFLYEGNDWGNRRDLIDDKNRIEVEDMGYLNYDNPDGEMKEYII